MDSRHLFTPKDEQPAADWASSTLSALSPSTEVTNPPSNATTPGLDIPGAFPGARMRPDTLQNDIQYAKDVAVSALETAKEYAQSAGSKVGEYVPPTVAAYLPATIAPSTLESEQDSLRIADGTVAESGFVPEAGLNGGPCLDECDAQSTPTTVSSMANDSSALPAHVESNSTVELSKHTGYVPESLSDASSIALLPEERQEEDQKERQSTGSQIVSDGASTDASIRSLPGSRMAVPGSSINTESSTTQSLARSSKDQLQPMKPHLSRHPDEIRPSQFSQVLLNEQPPADGRQHALATHEDKKFGANYRESVGPIATTSQRTDSSVATPGHEGCAPPVPKKDTTPPASGRAERRSSTPPSDTAVAVKKTGFISKIKGEVKVISGKIGHNEAKVEEGKRLMGKN